MIFVNSSPVASELINSFRILTHSGVSLNCMILHDLATYDDHVMRFSHFSPTTTLCYGVFSPEYLRCNPVQLQHQVPGKVPEGTEGSGADIESQFLEGSGADTEVRFHSGRFAQKVPVQIPRSGSGVDTEVRFRKVPVQSLGEAYGRFRVQ